MGVSDVICGIGTAQLDTLMKKVVPASLYLLSWLMLDNSLSFVETPSWEMGRRMLWVW